MTDPPPEHPGLFRRLWRGSGAAEKIKTTRYPLNAYGKLPIYKDFISTGLTETGAREFRGWLDRGFSHRWAVDENYLDTEIAPHSFLFRLPDGKGCVAGSLWGSCDQGGLRKFPFTLFVSFPTGQPAADPLTAIEYLALLDRRCQDLRDRFGPGASLASLYQAYRGAEFDCPLKTREQILREAKPAVSQVPLSEFAESLLGESTAQRWPSFLASVAEAWSSSAAGAGAIRLPLGGALPRIREVEFWLLWIARQDANRKRPPCGILYPNGSGPGRAVIFFRDLRAEDILLLHPTRSDSSDVVDVPRPAEPKTESPAPRLVEPLAAEPPTIALEPAAAAPPPAPAVEPAVVEPPAAPASAEPPPTQPIEPAAAAAFDTQASTDSVADAVPERVAEVADAEPAPPMDLSTESAPFPEAEILSYGELPDPPSQVEEPLRDSDGRPRFTQPPFALGALSSTEAAPEPPETPSMTPETPEALAVPLTQATLVAEEPVEPSPILEGTAEPPSPTLQVSALESSPATLEVPDPAPDQTLSPAIPAAEAASEASPPEVIAAQATPAAQEPLPPAAPGWDRPLFSLLEG